MQVFSRKAQTKMMTHHGTFLFSSNKPPVFSLEAGICNSTIQSQSPLETFHKQRNWNPESGLGILEESHRLPQRPGPGPSLTAHPCTVPPAWSRHSRSSWEISVASSLNIDGPWNTKQFTKWPWAEFIMEPEMKTVKRIGFDLRGCPALSSKIIFYPVLFLNVFSNSEERG